MTRFWTVLYSSLLLVTALFAEKEGSEGKVANRLLQEKSPYLLLHAYNPVDWYPWGEEAFKKARDEKKMILLSVGYSTCHWCHVMERESFENDEIAAYMNENFVAIKLDREERPDVDQVYMTALQAMTGAGGGWPLNMILTPELKPIFGGTYYPPVDRDGRSGFLTVLNKVQNHWVTDKERISKQVSQGVGQIQKYYDDLSRAKEGGASAVLKKKIIVDGIAKGVSEIDQVWGGLGQGEKFPQVSTFRSMIQSEDEKAREAALLTCRRMLDGGIYDQVGGGFHRYAVDREWLVPHFEKMLYDQAQLMELYLDAWLITGEADFKMAVRGTADYVLESLTHPEGGFYCAQDAQSEGKEGKYFCWTVAELKTLLSEDEMKLAREVLGVTEKGNFLDFSDPEALPNLNVLHFKVKRNELSPEKRAAVESVLKKLAEVRAQRVPPATDDKVLASWNGLMIAALARASRVLDQPRYLEAAKRAHGFVKAKLWSDGGLSHRWREGECDDTRQASSYLFLLSGTRALYEATLDPAYLTFANELAEGALELFYDAQGGGFFQSQKRDDIVLRLKGQFDNAMPSESSVGAREFAILGQMTGQKKYREISEQTLKAYHSLMTETGSTGMGEMLRALDYLIRKHGRLVIAGEDGKDALLKVAAQHFEPNRITLGTEGAKDEFTAGLKPVGGMATAYYCVGQTCQLPVNTPEALEKLLKRMTLKSKE
ncbi:thioredoxin domain-containing protein [Akkermansiaceae bacterium]|nr:thioredoxin domain-containing protein [Akkermansiaceae bacterium]